MQRPFLAKLLAISMALVVGLGPLWCSLGEGVAQAHAEESSSVVKGQYFDLTLFDQISNQGVAHTRLNDDCSHPSDSFLLSATPLQLSVQLFSAQFAVYFLAAISEQITLKNSHTSSPLGITYLPLTDTLVTLHTLIRI